MLKLNKFLKNSVAKVFNTVNKENKEASAAVDPNLPEVIDPNQQIILENNVLIFTTYKSYQEFRKQMRGEGMLSFRRDGWSLFRKPPIQVTLPKLKPWQQYVLSEKLNLHTALIENHAVKANLDISLIDEISQSICKIRTSGMKKDSFKFEVWKETTSKDFNDRSVGYILLGGSISKEEDSTRKKQLVQIRETFWQGAANDFIKIKSLDEKIEKLALIKELLHDKAATSNFQKTIKTDLKRSVLDSIDKSIKSSNELKKTILNKIKDYVNKNVLSIERAEQCLSLIKIIRDTDSNNLKNELTSFFKNNKQFQTRWLGRSKLRDAILNVDYDVNKYVTEVNPNEIDEKYLEPVLNYFKTKKPGEKIKKGELIFAKQYIFKFTASVEIPQPEIFLVMPGKGQGEIGSGAYGKVKHATQLMPEYSAAQIVKFTKKPSVKKTFLSKDANFTPKEIAEVEHEVEATQLCAPDLAATALVKKEANNKLKLMFFEEYAGESLAALMKKNYQFTYPQLIKILSDMLQQARKAEQAGYILQDIKPDNVAYCESTNKAVIIDHGSSIPAQEENSRRGYGTNCYMPTDVVFESYDKWMVFGIGLTMAELLVGKDIFGEKRKANTWFAGNEPLNLSKLDEYVTKNKAATVLVELIKSMIIADYIVHTSGGRIDLQTAIDKLPLFKGSVLEEKQSPNFAH